MTSITKTWILVGTGIITAIGLWFMGPIPQAANYHDFADQRLLWGIPNFWNVMSNLPFLLIGLFGLFILGKLNTDAALFLGVLFIGVFLTCFGSGYYHLQPSDLRVVFDRMAIVMIFIPFFALLIKDFIGSKQSCIAFWILLPYALLSILYWYFTETQGLGDMRFYIWVQAFPILAILTMLIAFPQKKSYKTLLWFILTAYLLAKIFEYYDAETYALGQLLSGHTIKHLLSAVSAGLIILLMLKRIKCHYEP